MKVPRCLLYLPYFIIKITEDSILKPIFSNFVVAAFWETFNPVHMIAFIYLKQFIIYISVFIIYLQ